MNPLLKLKQAAKWVEMHPVRCFIGSLVLLTAVVVALYFVGRDAAATVEQGVKENKQAAVFSKKQVKAKDKEIALLQQKVKVDSTIAVNATIKKDSAVVAAKHHEARADSAVKILIHENAAPSDDDPGYITGQLTNYVSQADTLPDGQILP